MADAANELERLEEEANEWKAQHKARVTAAESAVACNASKIRSGYEYRPVEVETVRDYTKGTVTVIRVDDGETVRARPMTNDEKQLDMLKGGDE
jgi:predicted neutral ceramidase superfamily lipid hydrolase